MWVVYKVGMFLCLINSLVPIKILFLCVSVLNIFVLVGEGSTSKQKWGRRISLFDYKEFL